MTSLPHLLETALLLAVAYLVGCVLGSGLRQLAQRRDRAFDLEPGVSCHDATDRLLLGAPAIAVLALPPPVLFLPPPSEPAPPISVEATEPAISVEPPMARMDAALLIHGRPAATVIALPTRDALLDAGEIAAIGRPPSLDTPRDGSPDDLQRIKGIGPRLAISLNALGIFHFDQIAHWNEMNLAWIEAQPHLRGRAARERWVEQAADFAGIRPQIPIANKPTVRTVSAAVRST